MERAIEILTSVKNCIVNFCLRICFSVEDDAHDEYSQAGNNFFLSFRLPKNQEYVVLLNLKLCRIRTSYSRLQILNSNLQSTADTFLTC